MHSAGSNFWDVGLPAGAELLEKETSADESGANAEGDTSEALEEPAASSESEQAS